MIASPPVPSPVASGADDPAQVRELLAFILPKPEEVKWQAIPWQTDLWAARRLALAEHKPIFLWAMNGSPLGCT